MGTSRQHDIITIIAITFADDAGDIQSLHCMLEALRIEYDHLLPDCQALSHHGIATLNTSVLIRRRRSGCRTAKEQ